MSSESRAPTRRMLGEILVEEDILTQHRLDQALAEHKKTGRRLGEVLMSRGWLSPVQLYDVLATQMGLDSLDLIAKPPQPVYAKLIPHTVAARLRALPVSDYGHQLVVAMADPLDMRAVDDLQTITGRMIRPMLANPEHLESAIRTVYKLSNDESEDPQQATAEETAETVSEDSHAQPAYAGWEDFGDLTSAGEAADASTIEFVEEMLLQGIVKGVSDIHLESTPYELRIRYRIDGVLADVGTAPMKMMAGIISRVKVMAEMDITNRRSPQDGRISVVTPDGRDVNLRAVTIPTVHGESLVLRILDSGAEPPKLCDVGMLPQAQEEFEKSFRAPSGGVLVTGPTGCGKTTTLYATLNELNKPETAIVTIEDPVEYRLAGLKQIQINNKAGMTFPTALRAILRSDPDVVLVGEIRDAEAAKLAA
ncbi:MAG: GspE/PulE family protein, partial [Acidimicrobiales bacterium]